MKNKRQEELKKITMEANEAKDRLYKIVYELQEEGFDGKAKSLMTIIYRIEEWQNRG